MRVVTFKIEEDLLEELDHYAQANGMTRSEVIRRAIREYLSRHLPTFRERVAPKVIRIYS